MRRKFGRPFSIHDHHDVTDEDVRADLLGGDYLYFEPETRTPLRSPINRLSATLTQEQRDAVVYGDLIITPEMLEPFGGNTNAE